VIGTILGVYEILELLGEGGMGEVYRARDTRLDRQVAIKILPQLVAADTEWLARLEREAKLLASLNHPNVASIYSMDEHEGTRFLVLELVEGESLSERLRRGPIPTREAVEIGRQVVAALRSAHEEGIVHRDLKPANVMITHRRSEVKVLDFGIAKALGADGATAATAVTDTGSTLGTTPYMSPEQLRGDSVDRRSDIWSFGCLFYQCLAGRSPFSRGTAAATAAAVLGADPDWGALPSAVPSRLRTLLRRCLERDPARRYQDVSKLEAELLAESDPKGGRPSRARLILTSAIAVGAGLAAVWIGGLLPPAFQGGGAAASEPIGSLSVLPVRNLSGDTAQDYIALAMTEMLTTDLSKLPLRVSGRESAIEFRNSDAPSVDIAAQLGVEALVRGTLVKIGDNVQISVRLIDTRETEQLLWTDSYAGTALEIFDLMRGTSATIADQIGDLTSDVNARMATARPIDPRAEQLFWRGFTELENYTQEPIQTAIAAFSEALQIEPEYASAHAELARAYVLAVQFNYLPSDESLPLARASAERALQIEPALAEARVALARLDYQASRDWTGIEEALLAVVRQNPNSVGGWHHYSHVLASKMKLDEAIQAALRGREVDPLSRTLRLHLVQLYRQGRRWEDAIAVADSTLERYPDYTRIRGSRASAYLGLGRVEEAVSEFEAIVSVSREPDNVASLAIALALAGRRDEAEELLSELMPTGGAWRIGRVLTTLGETDAAFDWLGRAIDQNVGPIADMLIDPVHDPLREHTARWNGLVRRAGFPEELIAAQASAR
jgi:serine/threonine protein kinase/tetratricopeptide (TPR) repeat protein